MRRSMWIGLVCVIALGVMLGVVSPTIRAEEEKPKKQIKLIESDVKVMSLNIRDMNADEEKIGEEVNPNHWSQRLPRVVAVVQAFDPDIFALQEARYDQIKDLKKALENYSEVGGGSYDGRTRGLINTIFYKKDRFGRSRDGMFWLSDTPNRPSESWTSDEPRTVVWAQLRDKQSPNGKAQITIANTQIDDSKRKSAIESIKLLRDYVNSTRDRMPVIVTGDFHYTDRSQAYSHLLSTPVNQVAPEILDAYRELNIDPAGDERTEHDFEGSTRGSRTDWILASRYFRPIDATIDRTDFEGLYPSHHYPVTATLRYVKSRLED